MKDIPKRLVDGATVNNVPEGILVREEADFIIASDVIALPPPPESLIPQILELPKFLPKVFDVAEAGLMTAGSFIKAVIGTAWPFARMQDTMRSMSYLNEGRGRSRRRLREPPIPPAARFVRDVGFRRREEDHG